MEIIRLDMEDGLWRKFLAKYNTLIFHTPEWKMFIEKSLGRVTTDYYAVIDEGEIRFMLPLIHVKHPVLGSRVISCGFIEYGGPAGLIRPEYLDAVVAEVSGRYSKGADYLEIRQGIEDFDSMLSRGSFRSRVDYKRFITKLDSAESLWGRIDKQKRKAVRKAESLGVSVREVGKNDVGELYELYLRNMKAFGSPPLPKAFFDNFFGILGDAGLAKGYGAYHDKKLIALLIGYTYRKRIHIIIAVSEGKFLQLRPNDAVHWEFMKWGCENGYEIFDWGRVREDSGQFGFKRLWASEMHDLNHYYLLWKSKELPGIDPTNPRYKLMISIWKRAPLFISRRIGPWLREGLGI